MNKPTEKKRKDKKKKKGSKQDPKKEKPNKCSEQAGLSPTISAPYIRYRRFLPIKSDVRRSVSFSFVIAPPAAAKCLAERVRLVELQRVPRPRGGNRLGFMQG